MEDKLVEWEHGRHEETKETIDHFIANDLYDHKDCMHEKVSYKVTSDRFSLPLMLYYMEKIFGSGLNIEKFTYDCRVPTVRIDAEQAGIVFQLLKLAELVQSSTTVKILGDISLDMLYELDDFRQFCERLYGNTTLRLLIIDLGPYYVSDGHCDILRRLLENTHIIRILFVCKLGTRDRLFIDTEMRRIEAELDILGRVPFEERGVQVFSKTKSAAKITNTNDSFHT